MAAFERGTCCARAGLFRRVQPDGSGRSITVSWIRPPCSSSFWSFCCSEAGDSSIAAGDRSLHGAQRLYQPQRLADLLVTLLLELPVALASSTSSASTPAAHGALRGSGRRSKCTPSVVATGGMGPERRWPVRRCPCRVKRPFQDERPYCFMRGAAGGSACPAVSVRRTSSRGTSVHNHLK